MGLQVDGGGICFWVWHHMWKKLQIWPFSSKSFFCSNQRLMLVYPVMSNSQHGLFSSCQPWFPISLSRTAADDDNGRPLKRIKLEQDELAAESDVVNLSNPYPVVVMYQLICVNHISNEQHNWWWFQNDWKSWWLLGLFGIGVASLFHSSIYFDLTCWMKVNTSNKDFKRSTDPWPSKAEVHSQQHRRVDLRWRWI